MGVGRQIALDGDDSPCDHAGMDPIQWSAEVQSPHYTGTVALDDADFEGIASIVGMPDDFLTVCVNVHAHHTSFGVEGKDHADEAYNGLELLAVPKTEIASTGGGLVERLRNSDMPLPLHRFTYYTKEVTFPNPLDAVGIVLRAFKRVSVVAWSQTVVESGFFDRRNMVIMKEHTMVLNADKKWEESDT